MPVKHTAGERMDDERVAALLDGRLAAGERDEVLARVTADPDEYDAFAELAAVLHDIEAEHGTSPVFDEVEEAAPLAPASSLAAPPAAAQGVETPRPGEPEGVISLEGRRTWTPHEPDDRSIATPGITPIGTRRGPRVRPWMYGALAAGIATIGLTFALLNQPSLHDPAGAVRTLRDGTAPGVAAGWNEPWRGTTRGGSSTPSDTTEAAEQAAAVRLGALLVDLELATPNPRDTLFVTVNQKVKAELEGIGGGGSPASIYREVEADAAAGKDVSRKLKEGRNAVRGTVPVDWFEAGIWAETARTAAARHDVRFFRSKPSRDALERVAKLEMDEEARAAFATVRRAIPRKGTPGWPRLQEAITEFLRLTGS